jgi:RNA polymerase sigma-70 factor (ECF subfamily)
MNSERALVDSVLRATPGAFERLVREYQRLCWHIIFRMVRHPQDAQDLCQETFLRVHRYLHQYRYDSPLKSWIGRIAYSVALRYLERRRIPLVDVMDDSDEPVMLETIGDGFDLEAACVKEDMARHLHGAFEALPPLQRTLITLYHIEDLSIPEIARMTGLAEGTIKSHLFRARLRLRAFLETLEGSAL